MSAFNRSTRAIPPQIPARLECWQCRKWKASEMFSNKQKKDYISSITSKGRKPLKVRCDQCANDQRTEMKCGSILSITAFSKSSRKSGGNHWCQDCTDWKLGVEPSVVIGPAPKSEKAPDEKPEAYDDDDDDSDIENNYHDNDDGTSTIYETGHNSKAWYGRPSRSEVPTRFDTASQITESLAVLNVENEHPYQPPHLRGPGYKGPNEKPAVRLADHIIPGHDRGTTSSESNPYDDAGDDDSTWKPVGRRAREKQAIHFNGYDNTGARHSQQRFPSTQNSSHSPNGSSSGAVKSPPPTMRANRWAKRAPAAVQAPVQSTCGPSPPPPTDAGPAYRYGVDGDSDDEYYD